MSKEPTPAAKALLAEAAAAYAAHQSIDRGHATGQQVNAQLAAQRSAAIVLSSPPEAKPDDRDHA